MLPFNFYILRAVSKLNTCLPGMALGQSLIFPAQLGGCFHFHLADEESEADQN